MAEQAKQAFMSKNFELAAELYEQTIKEKGPNTELLLSLANSLARGGKFKEALDSYICAFRYGDISSEKLKDFVISLTEMFSNKKNVYNAKTSNVDFFACLLCEGFLHEPTTIPCGHTFCKRCLEKEHHKICKKCGVYYLRLSLSNLKINILIANLTEKWFPKETKAAKLKMQGNELFRKQQFDAAIAMYNKAFELTPYDHLLATSRSYAYLSQETYSEALQDLELAIKLKPDWSKGYFHKGAVLFRLGRYKEAAISYLHCLCLDPGTTFAKTSLAKEMKPSKVKRTMPQVVTRVLEPISWQKLDGVNMAVEDNHPEKSDKESDSENLNKNNTSSFPSSFSNVIDNYTDDENLKKDTIEHITRSVLNTSEILPNPVSHKRKLNDHPELPKPCKQLVLIKTNLQYKTLKTIKSEDIDPSDFECTLCLRLFYQPVTTPCGHVFCRICLDRCLDHCNFCPLCKYNLGEYLAERRQAITEFIEIVIKTYLPNAYAERKRLHEEEITELTSMGKDSQHEIPIFICTMAYPTVPCPLHIFEPRYRLMMRQCIESGSRQFGMCTNIDGDERFANYGTMLEIRNVQYFQDGRSIVDTIGIRRFKVIHRGMRDGYHTAHVEFLKDLSVDGTAALELKDLHDQVHFEALQWFNEVHANTRERILRHFGPMPDLESDFQTSTNGPAWAWWILAILPLDSRAQLPILAVISLKERLLAIRRVLQFITRKNI